MKKKNKRNFNPSYIGKRNDIIKFIPSEAKFILDIGCSIGTIGRQIKEINNAYITGIELSDKMGAEASKYLDEVIIGNVEKGVLNRICNKKYDCIILADIIEHLIDPWKLVSQCYRILKNDGLIISSIPNIRHISTIFSLVVKGYWPYRDRGIHDKTHLRFFTLKNITQLFEKSNFSIYNISTKIRFFE